MHRSALVLVAPVDWLGVVSGAKREMRRYGALRPLVDREYPHPCVFYSPVPTGYVTALGVLEERWVEPLGAIGPESLEREGFADDYDAFRRYFANRHPKDGFRPLAKVIVQVVRPLSNDETPDWMVWLWHRAYGRHA